MIDCLLIALALTQTAEVDPRPLVLRDQMVITAERGAEDRQVLTAATSVISREEIEAMPVDDLGDIIDRFPGITTLLEGAGSRPMITARGFFGGGEVEYVLLLVDGVPVGDPESGLAHWSSIPAESIERVEYLRGPGSALYGDVALGGVVEVFTRSVSDAGIGHVSVEAGSFDTTEGTFAWTRRGLIDVGVDASLASTDGYRDHSATDRGYLGASAGFDASGGRFQVRLASSLMDREEPGMLPLAVLEHSPGSSSELFRHDREETARLDAGIDYTRAGRVPYRVLFSTGSRDSTLLRTVLLAAGFGDRIERRTEDWTLGASFTGSYASIFAGRPNDVRFGVDLSRDSIEAEYFPVGDSGQRGDLSAAEQGVREKFALFVTDHLELTQRLRFTAGVRYDALRDQFTTETVHRAWSPRAGMNLRLGRAGTAPYVVFLQGSRAFKAPSLDQLFGQRPYPDFQGGSFTVSNPDLEPQRASNLELGISRNTPSLRWELVAYRMDVEDEIDFDVATFSYRNIGESLHEGVEASAAWRLHTITPRVSYAWTRVQALDGDHPGRQLKNIPEHAIDFAAGITLPGAFHLDTAVRFLTGWFLDDANQVAMDDALELDFRLRRDFGPWGLRLDVLNVLDEVGPHVGVLLPDFEGGEVPYAYPSAGRRYRVGVERRF